METLLHAALSNAAVATVLAVIVTVFGRMSRRPALIHGLWLLVLIKLLTPPVWPISLSWFMRPPEGAIASDSTGFSHQARKPAASPEPANTSGAALMDGNNDAVPEETAPPVAVPIALSGATSLQAQPVANPLLLTETPHATAMAMFSLLSWQPLLLTIWLGGSALWLALAGCRLYHFHRLLRFMQRAPAKLEARAHRLAGRLGLSRCPGVWVVPAPVSPLLWALAGEPRLLVPASLLERLSEEQWDTLLAHELAHLRRRDHWVRILELAVLALYWWHPVVWWARRQLREAEELCCDAWVVWALPDAAEVYATALVEAVTYLSSARSALPLAASGIGQMHLLKRRLMMIMHGTTPRALSAAGFLAVLGLGAVLLPLCPTLARTQQRPDGAGDQPAQSGIATSVDEPQSAPDVAGPSGSPGAQGPGPDASPAGGVRGPGGVRLGGQRYGFRHEPGGREDYLETAEDAQDEVELLHVQLQLRRAERREVEARFRQAKNDVQRYSRLRATNAVDSSEVDQRQTELEVQEARLAAKDAQIKEAELRLKQAERRFRSRGAMGNAPAAPGGPGAIYGGPAGPGPGVVGGPMRPGGLSSGMQGTFGRYPRSSGLGGGGGGAAAGPDAERPMLGPAPSGSVGSSSSFEHRLAEVEKKLQTLMQEVKALHREQRPERSLDKP